MKWVRFSPLSNTLSSVEEVVRTVGGTVVGTVGGDSVGQVKYKSVSVPGEVKVTKFGFIPVTVSLIQFWYSDTRVKTAGLTGWAQPLSVLTTPLWTHANPLFVIKGPPGFPCEKNK